MTNLDASVHEREPGRFVRIGGFRAEFAAQLRAEEFSSFRSGVAALHESLRGNAQFATMEEQLLLDVSGDGRGHIRLQGRARDRAGSSNALSFEIDFDQTYLAATLRQLNALVREFPVRGSP